MHIEVVTDPHFFEPDDATASDLNDNGSVNRSLRKRYDEKSETCFKWFKNLTTYSVYVYGWFILFGFLPINYKKMGLIAYAANEEKRKSRT